jgi:hypothetical protein
MQLVKKGESKLLLFNGTNFLHLVLNVTEREDPLEGKFNVILAPVIQLQKPKPFNSGLNNYYEVIVYNITSEVENNTISEKSILHTQSSFVYSAANGLSKKELFELILLETDQNNSRHFFSYLSETKKKLWQLDKNAASIVDRCDFSLLKLGTKYRPYPELDLEDFFQPNGYS